MQRAAASSPLHQSERVGPGERRCPPVREPPSHSAGACARHPRRRARKHRPATFGRRSVRRRSRAPQSGKRRWYERMVPRSTSNPAPRRPRRWIECGIAFDAATRHQTLDLALEVAAQSRSRPVAALRREQPPLAVQRSHHVVAMCKRDRHLEQQIRREAGISGQALRRGDAAGSGSLELSEQSVGALLGGAPASSSVLSFVAWGRGV